MRKKEYEAGLEKICRAPLLCWDIFSEEQSEITYFKELPIGGFLKQSLIDYPGNISTVIFTKGCNLRCRYCHNSELVLPAKIKQSYTFNADDVLLWIRKNSSLLDAVVITGGEPCLHKALVPFIRKIKGIGLKVKLDTNGTNPMMLNNLLLEDLLDYVAMDVKAPLNLAAHRLIAGNLVSAAMLDNIKQSIEILNRGEVECEYRTTLDYSLDMRSIEDIAGHLRGKYFLQKYVDSPKNLSLITNETVKSINLETVQKVYPKLNIQLR